MDFGGLGLLCDADEEVEAGVEDGVVGFCRQDVGDDHVDETQLAWSEQMMPLFKGLVCLSSLRGQQSRGATFSLLALSYQDHLPNILICLLDQPSR